MIIVGLTGGIGSGKTTVAKEFEILGIPVYIADIEAKKLMNNSMQLQKEIIVLFGEQAYKNKTLNKPFIANIIFKDKTYLHKLNSIVHPKVAQHFKIWVAKQNAPYVIKEAAILFENGTYTDYDFIITVIAPEDLRVARVIERDNTTEKKVKAIIKNQWNDNEKMERSHYSIVNKTLSGLKLQVQNIHQNIVSKIH